MNFNSINTTKHIQKMCQDFFESFRQMIALSLPYVFYALLWSLLQNFGYFQKNLFCVI